MPIEAARRWGAEALLAVVAGAAFLGFLGSTELWGKREQRASAEALDTVDRGHWLVAEIQGRPRLEKPPLPRWITAGLIALTGRRDEAIVRLPNALAALATVGLVYLLGRGLGGRSVGLASGFALTSSCYFVVEMRQAGNDGLLTLFTTLALLAAWMRLHGPREGDEVEPPGDSPGARCWAFLFYLALGLGLLTKGPIILLMVGVTVVGYLATARRLGVGLRCLADGWGLAAFALLALAWPVPVLLRDPTAARVWWLEMAQKTGVLDISHERARESLVLDWLGMTLALDAAGACRGGLAAPSVGTAREMGTGSGGTRPEPVPISRRNREQAPAEYSRSLSPIPSRFQTSGRPRVQSAEGRLRLVVGHRQPGGLRALEGRQAELLPPVPARRGAPGRRGVGPALPAGQGTGDRKGIGRGSGDAPGVLGRALRRRDGRRGGRGRGRAGRLRLGLRRGLNHGPRRRPGRLGLASRLRRRVAGAAGDELRRGRPDRLRRGRPARKCRTGPPGAGPNS